MKKLWMAALCSVSLSHASTLPAPTTWKLATGYRAESFHTQNILQFARDVEQATAGQLLIQVHANNTLAKLNDISQAVQQGKAEAGETIMSSLVKDIAIADADSVPFVVNSYKDAQRLWKLQRPGIEKHFAERGLKLLYAVPWPPQGLHSSKPVDVAMVDVGQALTEGRMDNMITSALTGLENKVWGSIRYYYEINAWFPKNVVFVSSKAFEALGPEVRSTVLKAATDAEVRGWLASQALAMSATEELRRNGIRIERIPADLEQEIKRMGEKFAREWVRSVGNEANNIFVPYYLVQ